MIAIATSLPLAAQPDRDDSTPATLDEERRIGKLISDLLLEHIPHSYTDDKNWGRQQAVFDGIQLRRDSGHLRIETKRRWRQVNHGQWHRSTVTLVDPQHAFSAKLKNVQPAAAGGAEFDLVFHTPLAISARQANWTYGVQLYSVSADAEATVQLTLSCSLTSAVDYSSLPPDLLLQPQVKAAQIELIDFRIVRISKLGGEFAQQVTRVAREPLERKIAERQVSLVEKLNRQIEKHADQLRISWSEDLQSTWLQRFQPIR